MPDRSGTRVPDPRPAGPADDAVRSWRPRGVAGVAALLLVASACWSRPEPELLRRHAALEVADTTGLVGVALFSVPAGRTASAVPLQELSASAQTAMIRAVAEKTDSPEAFLHTLGPPAGADLEPAGPIDRTRFRRRVVISAENHAARPSRDPDGRWRASPGARIIRLRVAVGTDAGRARFLSWDRFASRYESVDLGEMSFRRERSSGLDLDVVPGDAVRELRSLAGDAARSSTLDEELPLRSRYASTGVLLPDSMILLQEGTVGVDLTGNVVLLVEIDVAAASGPARTVDLSGLFGPDGAPRPPDSVRVVARDLVHAADADRDVRATLRFDAVVRTIRPGGGDATWAEGDDHALHLVETSVEPPSTLVPARELRASVWQLATPRCDAFLHLEGGLGGRPEVVQLASADEAFALLRWLRARRPAEVAGRGLRLGPERALGPADPDELAVRLLPLNWRAGAGHACP